MHRDPQSQHVRLVDQRLHFVEIVLLCADRVGLREHAAGAAEFDDLRAVLAQFAHRGADLLGAVGDGGSRHRDRGRKFGGIAVAAGGADGVGRRNDARTGHDALFDALLDGHVVVIGRTHIADGGEARLEGLLGVGHADHRPEIVGEFQAAIAAVTRVGGEVRMHVDQSRQQRHAGQIDAARARRHRRSLEPDRGDAPVRDRDLRMIDDPSRQHIDHSVGGHHHGVGMRHGQRGNAKHCAGNDGGAWKSTRSHSRSPYF